MSSDEVRDSAIRDLFKSWDLDGNGTVEYGEMQQILQASARFDSKDSLKWIKKFEALINQGQKENRRGSRRGSISVQGGGQINFSEVDGEPSLDPDAFVSFLSRLTKDDTEDEFNEFLEFSKKWIDDAANSTQGSKQKKDIWEIFQLLDTNHDGFVDMAELETLLNAEKKTDRKVVLKWRASLQQQAKDQHSLPSRKVSPKDEEAEEDQNLKLTLSDFQLFIHEFVEGDEENKIPQLVSVVRKAVQEAQVQYIVQYKIHDVVNDIMDDLLKERPQDVLGGIEKSVARLKRLQMYPKPMKKGKE